jgi:hypothetical protein
MPGDSKESHRLDMSLFAQLLLKNIHSCLISVLRREKLVLASAIKNFFHRHSQLTPQNSQLLHFCVMYGVSLVADGEIIKLNAVSMKKKANKQFSQKQISQRRRNVFRKNKKKRWLCYQVSMICCQPPVDSPEKLYLLRAIQCQGLH